MTAEAISLCMIAKNAESSLERCLDSVKSLQPEIVIADTGSSDSTPEIARERGATVTTFDFTFVDFAAARNHTLAQASGKWILILDADETLDPAGIPTVQDLIEQSENAGYYFERLNHRPAPEPATTDYAIRLFPNRPGYRYRGRVHETVDASILAGAGRLVKTGIRIHHEFASDQHSRRQKNLWYIAILNEEIAADPSDSSRLDFLAAEYHQLGMFQEAAKVAEQIATVRPLDATAHLHAGVYHLLYTGEPDRARLDLLTALRLRPHFPEAQAFLETLIQL
jgi:glycosyltransferase involved in cell wall biosynthesis